MTTAHYASSPTLPRAPGHSTSRPDEAAWLRSAFAASALASLLGGCQPSNACAETGTPCGGDPSGTWTVVDACQNPLYAPPLAPTYTSQPKTASREVPPEATSSDWCSALQAESNTTVTNFTFPTQAAVVRGGALSLRADGTYRVTLDIEASGDIELSASCLTQFGANPSCTDLATALDGFAMAQDPEPPKPSYSNISCASADGGACGCTYAMHARGQIDGRWSVNGAVLTFFEASSALPSQANYCVVEGSGGVMSLWGANNASLFYRGGALNQGARMQTTAEVLGSTAVRTLSLRKQ